MNSSMKKSQGSTLHYHKVKLLSSDVTADLFASVNADGDIVKDRVKIMSVAQA